eukprot:13038690-Alexandrium_andersonii.AAC.1
MGEEHRLPRFGPARRPVLRKPHLQGRLDKDLENDLQEGLGPRGQGARPAQEEAVGGHLEGEGPSHRHEARPIAHSVWSSRALATRSAKLLFATSATPSNRRFWEIQVMRWFKC